MGLESLNENLPEIKIDLVFKSQKLQVRLFMTLPLLI